MASGVRTGRVDAAVGTPSKRGSLDAIIDAGWNALTSVRLAIFLILALAAGAFVGAAIMQAPPPALADPQQYDLWLVEARQKYGAWTGPFDGLQFFQVFSSFWFRALVVLLSGNILVCTADRTPRLLALVRRVPATRVADGMFEKAPLHSRVEFEADRRTEAEAALLATLKRHRFKIRTERTDGAVHVFAEKNKFARLGTLVHHAGLIVVLLGAIWGGRGGFRESQFIIAEGDTRPVGHETGLSIRLDSFIDEYYTGGGGVPKDYRSNVVVLEDGAEVASGTVRVNEPLIHDGVRVHQAFYGPAINMRVSDAASGREFIAGPIPLSWRTQERPAGSFVIPEANIEVFLIGTASAFIDEVIPAGEVRLEAYALGGESPLAIENLTQGTPKTIGGLDFLFERESRFTGLQVVKDPGLPLVWFGSAIVVLGTAVVLNFPHRRLWGRLVADPSGRGRVMLAAPKERGLPFDYEFKQMAEALGQRFAPPDAAQPTRRK